MDDDVRPDGGVDQHEDEQELYDENAFGLWISWFDAEQVEYSQSAGKFPPRIIVFRKAVADYLESFPLGDGVTALDMGTAAYLEIAQGDEREDVIAWTRSLRAFLANGDWRTVAVITHGGRWVSRAGEGCMPPRIGDVTVLASFGPSEPFRKAVAAEAMTRDDDETGEAGWGPGLFVDTEALEALGRKLKNAPTPLRFPGGCFFRLGA